MNTQSCSCSVSQTLRGITFGDAPQVRRRLRMIALASLRDADRPSVRAPVNTALGLRKAGPAPGARVVARSALHRARHAADRAVALGHQRMARKVIVVHVFVEVTRREAGERFHLEAPI